MNIRPMQFSDIELICKEYCFAWVTLQQTQEKWQKYFKEQQEGARTVALVCNDTDILGYASLLYRSPYFSNIARIGRSSPPIYFLPGEN